VPLPDEKRQRHDRERDDRQRETSHGDHLVSVATAPVALLIDAYVATTVVLLWLAVSDARMLPHDDGELTFGHRIGFHPQVVPPEPWAVPAAIGLLLIALVLATMWTVRRR
jgi:hypothetical protein